MEQGDIFVQLTNNVLLLIGAVCILLGVGIYFVYRRRKQAKKEQEEDEEEAELHEA